MYYILNLQINPPMKEPDLVFETEQEACDWIDNNGDAVKYTILKEND